MEERTLSAPIRNGGNARELWRSRSWSVPQVVDWKFCPPTKVAALVLFWLVVLLSLIMHGRLVDTYNSLNLMEIVLGTTSIYPGTQSGSGSSHTALIAAARKGHPSTSCLSRAQHMNLRPASQMIPSSPGLISALSAYEKHHAQCLGSHGQNWILSFMRSLNGTSLNTPIRCQFLIYVEGGAGLGNRLVSLVSAFVFALFTNRVLLLLDSSEATGHVARLLCEPFPGSSWVLPSSFPVHLLGGAPDLNTAVNTDFANATKILRLNLDHSQNWGDQRVFCAETRERIREIDWVVWTSNQYFVPRLLTFPEFWPRFSKIFPNPSHIFTHLSRYLLLPSDPLWEKIVRVYSSYLSTSANKLVGIQIRRHSVADAGEFNSLAMERIFQCLVTHRLLPNVSTPVSSEATAVQINNQFLVRTQMKTRLLPRSRKFFHGRTQQQPEVTTVLITALHPTYADMLRDMYTNLPTTDGSLVRVHMVSHEGMEWHSQSQSRKAFVEMWLLSFSNKLATSSYSTFGYIAQGLGALRPYIVNLRGDLDSDLEDHMDDPDFPNLHCVVGQSPEPCNHYPFWPKTDCGDESLLTRAHEAWVEKHLTNCQDESMGCQLIS